MALAWEEKNWVLHELGNKTQLGVWAQCEPLDEISRGPGAKILKNLQYLA